MITKVYTFIREVEVCSESGLHTYEEDSRHIIAVTSDTKNYDEADAEAYGVYRRLMAAEENFTVPEFGRHEGFVAADGYRYRIKLECAEWVDESHFYAVSL